MNYWIYPGIKIKNEITPEEILLFLEKYNAKNYTIKDIIGKKRNRQLVYLRQIYCMLARKYTKLISEEIGSYINRDHATVLYSIQQVYNVKELNIIYNNYEQLFKKLI